MPRLDEDNELRPLVVEGWIEEGEAPVVMVTRALNLNEENSKLEDAIEKWCRVTIFDDEVPHILTARKNPTYNPSFIFTTNKLIGQAGHTYRLLVETDDTIAFAVANLRSSVTIDHLEAVSVEGVDSLYVIRAYLKDITSESYYKLFCKGETDRRFYPSFLGNIVGEEYEARDGAIVSRGPRNAFLEEDNEFSHYFNSGESVEVKVCEMDKSVYDFWNMYDLNVSLSSNLFLTFTSDCPGNIIGAKGYWAAYGSSLRICDIP